MAEPSRPAAYVVHAFALLIGCSGSPERLELPDEASPEASGLEAASIERERCASFTDAFSIVLADGTRYVETHNDVCGGRACELEERGRRATVACLPAPEPQLGITARHLAGAWFEVRSASEGIASFAVIEWTPAASRIVLERDLGLMGEVEARIVEGRVALVANCDLEAPGCPLLGPPDAPVSRSWWLDPSGRLSR